ncbi:MAG: sulfatase-like hydrolase/transferase [Imperialibacter sp.]|uniref:sulfatase family protein n=1 Tax=Imperialibacter sp. TaxID=2038411 RepID=UPI0032EB3B76
MVENNLYKYYLALLETIAGLLVSFALLLLFTFAVSGCTQPEKRDETTKRPNVIVILTDQHNPNATSAHGNKYLSTPNLDYLVNNGISFANSYCTTPVCGPSRSSLITGLMPHNTGVDYNGDSMKDGVKNLGEILSAEGYETVWAGKWHIPGSYPQRKDIDTLTGFKVIDFYENDKPWDLGADTDGPLADATVEYIQQFNGEKPLLMYVQFHNPHDICHFPRKPENYPNVGPDVELPPLPANHEIDPNEPEMIANSRFRDHYGDELLLSQDNDETRWRNYLWYYYRNTEMVDAEIGKVLDALRAKGMDENTIIVVSADHGDGMTEKKWAAKLSLYDGPAKVPFVVYYKDKVKATGVDNQLVVSGADVVPTILDYIGVTSNIAFDGVSRRPYIDSNKYDSADFVVTELAVDPFDKSLTGRMIRNNRYKYNYYSKGERNEELFDMVNDPLEMNNLSGDEEYLAVKTELKGQLKKRLAETKDPFQL